MSSSEIPSSKRNKASIRELNPWASSPTPGQRALVILVEDWDLAHNGLWLQFQGIWHLCLVSLGIRHSLCAHKFVPICPQLYSKYLSFILLDNCSPDPSSRKFLFATDRDYQKTTANQTAEFQSLVSRVISTIQILHLRLRDHCRRGERDCRSQRTREFVAKLSPRNFRIYF